MIAISQGIDASSLLNTNQTSCGCHRDNIPARQTQI